MLCHLLHLQIPSFGVLTSFVGFSTSKSCFRCFSSSGVPAAFYQCIQTVGSVLIIYGRCWPTDTVLARGLTRSKFIYFFGPERVFQVSLLCSQAGACLSSFYRYLRVTSIHLLVCLSSGFAQCSQSTFLTQDSWPGKQLPVNVSILTRILRLILYLHISFRSGHSWTMSVR